MKLPFIAAVVSLAVASPAVTLPAVFQANYDKLTAAINSGDFQTFQSYFAPSFVSVDPAGKTMKRDAFLKEAGAMIKSTKKGNLKPTFTALRYHGRTISVSFNFAGTIETANGVLSFHEVGTDTWAQTGKEWKLVKTVDTLFKVAPVRK